MVLCNDATPSGAPSAVVLLTQLQTNASEDARDFVASDSLIVAAAVLAAAWLLQLPFLLPYSLMMPLPRETGMSFARSHVWN